MNFGFGADREKIHRQKIISYPIVKSMFFLYSEKYWSTIQNTKTWFLKILIVFIIFTQFFVGQFH